MKKNKKKSTKSTYKKWRFSGLLILALLGCSSNDPEKIFEDRTGLLISEPINNVKVTDNYELTEGEFSIVFETTEAQINSWLNSRPPWNNGQWHKGQIPHNIGIAVRFNFPEGVGYSTDDKGKSYYYGDNDLTKLFNDTTNYFIYVEDCCPKKPGLRFHDGRLLILQPQAKMVYYSVWDF